MECPICGDTMECILYSDDTGDYIHWVCYVCEVGYAEGQYEWYPVGID